MYYLRTSIWDDYLVTGVLLYMGAKLAFPYFMADAEAFALLMVRSITMQDLASYSVLAACCYLSRGIRRAIR